MSRKERNQQTKQTVKQMEGDFRGAFDAGGKVEAWKVLQGFIKKDPSRKQLYVQAFRNTEHIACKAHSLIS